MLPLALRPRRARLIAPACAAAVAAVGCVHPAADPLERAIVGSRKRSPKHYLEYVLGRSPISSWKRRVERWPDDRMPLRIFVPQP